MELIYTDKSRNALGQLSSFDLDFDAADEKNFVLTIDEALLQKDYCVYIPDTEIGGIIDSISVNSADESVKYSGRNWRGVLNDKVLSVPREQNYISVQGDIKSVFNELLAEADLDAYFTCVDPPTEGIDLDLSVGLEPFCTLYDGLMAIASAINFKLLFAYNAATNKVEITPEPVANYTDILTYSKNNSINIDLTENAMSTNHILLVGYDDDGNRYQIDLFVNADAMIEDYATVLNPTKDDDYILDNRNQQFFGIDEKTKVEITDRVSTIENYEVINEQPDDWESRYADKYFAQEVVEKESGNEINYKNFESVTRYRQLSSQPADWAENYGNYFYIAEGGEYKHVPTADPSVFTDYKELAKKPKDWKENYKSYFYHETDGVSWFWVSVSARTKDKYVGTKYKPTDWQTEYKDYYEIIKVLEPVPITSKADVGKTKFTMQYVPAGTKCQKTGWHYTRYYDENGDEAWAYTPEYSLIAPKKAPDWQPATFYKKESEELAPKFNPSVKAVYAKVETQTGGGVPTFAANQVYQQYESAPLFTRAWKKVYDHYGAMIDKAITDLQLSPMNSQEVSITDFDADIGDIVGGYSAKADISTSAQITNIIYRIERGIQRSIDYVLGG